MNKVTNVKFAGLGGQGILTCTDILGRVVFDMGNDVKKAEVHGMSQRGGSITSDLRFGDKVLSPMISAGQADFLVVMGEDLVEANQYFLKDGGMLVKPSDFEVDQLTNKRTLNVALLGALSKHMPFSVEQWMDAVRAQLPERLHEVNEAAFMLGRGE
ncbi:2-oxoacid:acceptor oxidoreductase family protein [Pontiella agarivorans]|uniref:2-oxoacid:acceptor oxidoreductase family protein n=1 Tax=Pontiella agarivorans TaxID=3038953 RepID=A0ABU5N1X6_9BACT|nr:2-oxoacid:acceptor oxidoreductase family protein [Pontiella agarivorans]MDZ8120398.1 2-oxoacid:acceptor oxidoreductase family protein [Pontiella agarivorans]